MFSIPRPPASSDFAPEAQILEVLRARPAGFMAWLDVATIAKKVGASVSATANTLRRLADEGKVVWGDAMFRIASADELVSVRY